MICVVYAHLDARRTAHPAKAAIRVVGFGAVKLTETTGCPKCFVRRKPHLAALDKDCFCSELLKRSPLRPPSRQKD